MANMNPILLVGGGTGGHITPLVAVGEELSVRAIPFIFVGSPHSREQEIVKGLGWQFLPIQAGKWRRYATLASFVQNLVDIGRTGLGFFQAVGIIQRYKIETVFSKGGFVALPVVLAARLLGKRVIIHESDAVMGMTNKISARFATKVLTAFAPSVFEGADNRYQQVGIPIRAALRKAASLKAPKKSRPMILIIPGSQGSLAINGYVKNVLTDLLKLTDVVHLTGVKEFDLFADWQRSLPASSQSRYKPYSYIDRELPYYFQAADLVVARSSATTAAEAALFKKAVYLIPLPTSASNHQVVNGQQLAAAGAAVVKEQYQLSPPQFLADIQALLGNPSQLTELGDRLNTYFNATETIDKIITELTNG